MQMSMMFGMLMQILNNDIVTCQQLADKFELSKRTVYRYINALSEAGIPIASKVGKYGGWSIVSNYKLRAVYLTEEELSRMVYDVESSSLKDNTSASIVSKLKAIDKGVQYKTAPRFTRVPTVQSAKVAELMPIFQKCINSNTAVLVEYKSIGASSSRILEPISIIFRLGCWYVHCYCRYKDDFRTYRLSNFVNVKVTNEQFISRNAVEFDTSKAVDNLVNLELVVSSDSISEVERWLGANSIVTVGTLTVARARVAHDDSLVKKLIALGKGVRVASPISVKKAIVDKCNEIARIYS